MGRSVIGWRSGLSCWDLWIWQPWVFRRSNVVLVYCLIISWVFLMGVVGTGNQCKDILTICIVHFGLNEYCTSFLCCYVKWTILCSSSIYIFEYNTHVKPDACRKAGRFGNKTIFFIQSHVNVVIDVIPCCMRILQLIWARCLTPALRWKSGRGLAVFSIITTCQWFSNAPT